MNKKQLIVGWVMGILLLSGVCLADPVQLKLSEDRVLLGGKFTREPYAAPHSTSKNWVLGKWEARGWGRCNSAELTFLPDGNYEFWCQLINSPCKDCPAMVENIKVGGTYKIIDETTVELSADLIPENKDYK